MTYKMHLLTSTTAGYALLPHLGITPNLQLLAFIALGALLPDIDEPQSFLGRRLLPLSFIISIFFRHRTITHNLALYAFIIALFWAGNHPYKLEICLVAFGAILHILGDMCSVSGVALYPFKKSLYILPQDLRFRVGSLKEYLVSIFIALLILISSENSFQDLQMVMQNLHLYTMSDVTMLINRFGIELWGKIQALIPIKI